MNTCQLEVCPATVSEAGLCQCTLERLGIPGRGAELTTNIDSLTRLTTQKMLNVEIEHGYKRTGHTLTSSDGKTVAIVDASAVRWLSQDEFWSIMHPD